jgi:hypothetical protein
MSLQKMKKNTFLLLMSALIWGAGAFGQTGARAEYIQEYAQIAVDEMNRSGVPASITLAQGILESGNGKSELARKSNNHFGIKCHSSWTGERVYHDDDEKGECFRKYDNVRHSFEDHTDFLVRGSRYDFLFDLDPTDYKGWAKGLKKAGYATAPDYADRLIKIIEDEMLYKYDREGDFPTGEELASDEPEQKTGPVVDAKGRPVKNARQRFIVRRMMEAGSRVPFVVLAAEERIEYVADSLNLPVAALLQFNDMTWETQLQPGDRIYIDEKKGRGATKTTVVRTGETLRDISQREQVKLAKIYKYNGFNVGYQPMVGDEIRLRPIGIIERFKGQ